MSNISAYTVYFPEYSMVYQTWEEALGAAQNHILISERDITCTITYYNHDTDRSWSLEVSIPDPE